MQNFMEKHPDFKVYQSSVHEAGGISFFLAVKGDERFIVCGNKDFTFYDESEGADILLKNFPWLRATVAGLKSSFGFGDRLGLATPGHINALKDRDFFPIFAQQSVRELERTERNFKDVMQSAILGSFMQGYKGGFGADADHIKETVYLEQAVDAGFTFFTIDPSDKIKNPASLGHEEKEELLSRYFEDYRRFFEGKKFTLGDRQYEFSEEKLQELVITYGEGLEHIERCYRFLKNSKKEFDFEVSVDETSVSTTPLAHKFIADSLQRRQVEFQSLALRFPGSFEKGIDYKGDIDNFKKDIAAHALIREQSGDYKMSLHSGSDKFSVYPAFKGAFGSKIHVKTAGTSWIEAVKVIAEKDFDFFMELLQCGIKNFGPNAASYEISAEPKLLDMVNLSNTDTVRLFYDNNIRQIIHISYGTILTGRDVEGGYIYRDRFFSILRENENRYYEFLQSHLGKHLQLLS